MDISSIVSSWKTLHDAGLAFWIALGVFLWAVEKVLEFVATLTPWGWDDNLGVILANLIKKLWNK